MTSMNINTGHVLIVIGLLFLAVGFTGILSREHGEAAEVKEHSLQPTVREPVVRKSSEWQEFEATAYCPCEKCCGRWASRKRKWFVGVPEVRIIATDPKVIPKGSRVEIYGMGIFYAEDTGSAIKGRKIDIYYPEHQTALQFGRRKVKVRW